MKVCPFMFIFYGQISLRAVVCNRITNSQTKVSVRKTGGTDPTGLHYVDKQEEGEKGAKV